MKRYLAIALLLCALPVAAQPAAKTAEEHYEASKKFYNIEKYDEAIAELKKAYELSPDPVYLFNIAQAMRKKGDCAGALDYYRKYLRDDPNASNKAKVEQWMVDMEACAKTQPKVVDTTVPVDPKPVEPKPVEPKPVKPVEIKPKPVVVTPPSDDGNRNLRLAGLTSAGVGGALLIAGTLLALNVRGIENEIESACRLGACDWDEQSERDKLARGRTTLSRLSFVVGGIAVAGGGVMFFLGRKTGKEARVTVVPADGGGLLVTGGRF